MNLLVNHSNCMNHGVVEHGALRRVAPRAAAQLVGSCMGTTNALVAPLHAAQTAQRAVPTTGKGGSQ